MLSSFADAGRVADGLARADLVVSYDLFWNDTARRVADLVLPATSWLEELGCKSTNTHLYLMPKILDPPGETRPVVWILRALGSFSDAVPVTVQ
jgi:anaerobic selenocysteine-containing dehydrogenase